MTTGPCGVSCDNVASYPTLILISYDGNDNEDSDHDDDNDNEDSDHDDDNKFSEILHQTHSYRYLTP